MPTLDEAQAAHAKASAAHDKARLASESARDAAAELRASVKAGNGSKVTAAQIVEADAAAEHAALVHHGAGVDLPALSAAVKAARADEACDEVVAELPVLGRDVALALEAIDAVLSPLVAAAERYDTYVAQAVHRLQKVAPSAAEPTYEAGSGLNPRPAHGTAASPFSGQAETPAEPAPAPVARFKSSRYGAPTVDGIALTSCRGPGQLAAVLVPAMRELGASEGLIEGLKMLAAGAPQLPTT